MSYISSNLEGNFTQQEKMENVYSHISLCWLN